MIDFGYGVSLKTIDKNELKQIRHWRNDSSVRDWCRQYDLISEDAQEAWYSSLLGKSDVKMYGIHAENVKLSGFITISPTLVGVCGLTYIDLISRRAEFSLYIGPVYQKRGYAKAALKTLIQHGFYGLNLNLIWGETFMGNPAYELFLKMGMKHEGTRRQFYFKNGRYIDAHLVSITRGEFVGTVLRDLEPATKPVSDLHPKVEALRENG